MKSTTTLPLPKAPARRHAALGWIAFITAFLLLTFAAALRAENLPARASRTEQLNASGPVKALLIENTSGDVEVTAGSAFSATVDLTVKGRDDRTAQRILGETKAVLENESGELHLYTNEPGTSITRRGRHWNFRSSDDRGWRVEARYRVTLPPSAGLQLNLVNGNASVKGLTGELELESVNGKLEVVAASKNVSIKTVNGGIVATLSGLPRGSDVKAETVNGSVTLHLPANAGFDFQAHTMNGDIVTTFPVSTSDDERRVADETRRERDKLRAEQDRIRQRMREKMAEKKEQAKRKASDEDLEEIEIDLSELNEAMADLSEELAGLSQEIASHALAQINKRYETTVNGGGSEVRCSTLNGRVALLVEGTSVDQARKVIVGRIGLGITVPPMPARPRVVIRAPRAPLAPMTPAPPAPPAAPRAPRAPISPYTSDEEGSIVKGDIQGDFYSSIPNGDVRLGKVSGAVKVTTHSGQIKIDRVGKGGELLTSGGDIRVDAADGDLKATSWGGDVVIGSVGGETRIETAGGDVIVRSSGGPVTAKTGGGDVKLSKAKGPIRAETAGGQVVCQMAPDAVGPVELITHGGDVTVILPASFKADVDVRVSGVDSEGTYIVSAFPELSVSRRNGSQSADGKLNGGGPRLRIRTSSGTVTINKG